MALKPFTDIRPFGPRACLFSGGAVEERVAFAEAAAKHLGSELREWVMGDESLLLVFSSPLCAPEDMLARLAALPWACTTGQGVGQLHELRIRYDGPDLEAVAKHCQLSPEALVAAHSAVEYQVGFMGFAPGFAYLDGLPEQLHCPRRARPRPRMRPGAVAIGGPYTGIYPVASPGGWNWIGHCEHELFHPVTPPHFTLQVGDRVRLIPQ